jgi:outer membrane protein assembly factor BamE (lipoprotein component of BamABCDE complex)
MACATDPADRGKELAAHVQVGTTTKTEVLQLFGFPTKQKKATSDGHAQEVWTYVYAGQGATPSNALTITFDAAGVVSAISPETEIAPPSTENTVPSLRLPQRGPR